MNKIKIDRDSVYIGDDIESHAKSFEVDYKMSINDFVNFLHSVRYIDCGRECTWILQIRNDKNYYRDIAIFANNGKFVKILDFYEIIDDVIKHYNPKFFYIKFLGEKDPEVVYNCLQKLRFGF